MNICIRTTYYIFCMRNKEWKNPELWNWWRLIQTSRVICEYYSTLLRRVLEWVKSCKLFCLQIKTMWSLQNDFHYYYYHYCCCCCCCCCYYYYYYFDIVHNDGWPWYLRNWQSQIFEKKKKWRPEFGSKSSPTLGVFLPFSQILFISFFLKSHTMIAYNNV